MNKVMVKDNVYYVGCQDWAMRDFHGYYTPRGVTYNSYLVLDEKICLIDLVKFCFAEELLNKVKEIVALDKIDCIVLNHVENDHASSLPEVLKHLRDDVEIYVSAAGKREAEKLYGKFNYVVVKDMDTISIGKNNLQFATLPMLHWPDSMVTYLDGEKILFSNDAFGQHYCASNPFDDKHKLDDIMYEAGKYYANILSPYTKLVPPALKKLSTFDLKMIAPSHGVIWRSHVNDVLDKYEFWGNGGKKDKVLVVYETMWGATEKMARAVVEGVSKAGFETVLHKLSVTENSSIAEDLLEAKGVLFGSPTLNYGMHPLMGKLLIYLKGLKQVGKKTAVFGTYGWSGGAQKDMEELLDKASMEILEGLTIMWQASDDEIKKCEQFGYDFGMKLKE